VRAVDPALRWDVTAVPLLAADGSSPMPQAPAAAKRRQARGVSCLLSLRSTVRPCRSQATGASVARTSLRPISLSPVSTVLVRRWCW